METFDIKILFLVFMFYSIIGWMYETMKGIVMNKKFVNRGFFLGPWIPIYGVGALFLTTITKNFTSNPFFLAVFSIISFSILEYLTSYILEKIFKARWWDYSKRKFNINGRVCLKSITFFTIAGLFMIYIVNPFIIDNLININPSLITIISGILFLIFFADSILSICTVYSIRKTVNNIIDDDTEEISEKVKIILLRKKYVSRRYISAYPDFYIKY